MNYVDNLLEVKPEEIRHVNHDTPIQAIIKIKQPSGEYSTVLVMWENGNAWKYSINGKYVSEDSHGEFIFRPKKIKKLKPLHVILNENPGYHIDTVGTIWHHNWRYGLTPYMLDHLGTDDFEGYRWDDSWIEEVEE